MSKTNEYSILKEERDSFEHTIHEQQIEISRLTQMNVNNQRRINLQEEKIMELEGEAVINTSSEEINMGVPRELTIEELPKNQDHFEPYIVDGDPGGKISGLKRDVCIKSELIEKLESQLKSQVKIYDDLFADHEKLLNGLDKLRNKYEY